MAESWKLSENVTERVASYARSDDHQVRASVLICIINLHQLRNTCVGLRSGELNLKR
jgi:hypothetical protein